MRLLATLICLLVSCADSGPVQHRVDISGDVEIISQDEPNIEAMMVVLNHESHITFRCEAWWNTGGPTNTSAPRGVLAEACAAGRCNKNLLGSISEVTYWSSEFHRLEDMEAIYCIVFMPEWYTTTGPHGFPDVEYPERTILAIRVPVTVRVEPVDRQRYCNSVVCDSRGCRCTSWY